MIRQSEHWIGFAPTSHRAGWATTPVGYAWSEGTTVLVPFSMRALRAVLVPLGLCVALAPVPTVASASIGLGVVVSANPANVTPNVASGAVYKLLQVGGTMYAGGAFSSVSTPAGVSPAAPSPAATSSPSTPPPAWSPRSRPASTAWPGAAWPS